MVLPYTEIATSTSASYTVNVRNDIDLEIALVIDPMSWKNEKE